VFREETAPPNAKDIPSMQLINQTLLYAKELERIV
jgi:26S proteasome regulatory subunit N12